MFIFFSFSFPLLWKLDVHCKGDCKVPVPVKKGSADLFSRDLLSPQQRVFDKERFWSEDHFKVDHTVLSTRLWHSPLWEVPESDLLAKHFRAERSVNTGCLQQMTGVIVLNLVDITQGVPGKKKKKKKTCYDKVSKWNKSRDWPD